MLYRKCTGKKTQPRVIYKYVYLAVAVSFIEVYAENIATIILGMELRNL